jgi:cobalamin biosynthesis Mg chelatase CobN
MSHECAVPDCDILVGQHLLMCGGHWFQVPPELRRRVTSTYHAWQRRTTLRPDPQLYQRYLAARDMAIGSVTVSNTPPRGNP